MRTEHLALIGAGVALAVMFWPRRATQPPPPVKASFKETMQSCVVHCRQAVKTRTVGAFEQCLAACDKSRQGKHLGIVSNPFHAEHV